MVIWAGGIIVGFVVFVIGLAITQQVSYGDKLDLSFGSFLSAVVGIVAGFMWPITVLGAITFFPCWWLAKYINQVRRIRNDRTHR